MLKKNISTDLWMQVSVLPDLPPNIIMRLCFRKRGPGTAPKKLCNNSAHTSRLTFLSTDKISNSLIKPLLRFVS